MGSFTKEDANWLKLGVIIHKNYNLMRHGTVHVTNYTTKTLKHLSYPLYFRFKKIEITLLLSTCVVIIVCIFQRVTDGSHARS